MFTFTKKDKKSALEKEIDNVISMLSQMDPASEEYTTAVKNLKILYESNEVFRKACKVSPDTKAILVGNAVGMAAILTAEHTRAITSKALSFIIKGRV